MVVDDKATHTESAWKARLPSALTFLLGPWWSVILGRTQEGGLYRFAPRRLKAGQHATMLVDSSKSSVLSGSRSLRLVAGFNGWVRGSSEQ